MFDSTIDIGIISRGKYTLPKMLALDIKALDVEVILVEK
jgi:hypothetical protein